MSLDNGPDAKPEGRDLEGRLRERVAAGGFAVTLSGGGHRATLASIGALLALVDRRLNQHVLQIASISGGSITNAFIAQRCDFDELQPGQLDDIASELATTIVTKGVLTPTWIAGIITTGVVVGVVVISVLQSIGLSGKLAIISALIGLMAGFGTLLLSGHVIEWLLGRRYFGRASETSRPRIASLANRRVDHVFGTTDLVLGLPMNISSQYGGMVHRWLGPKRVKLVEELQPFQTFKAAHWSLAAIVRASAAFPGIPPRRVKMPPDKGNSDVAAAPTIAFLADGGIWNNLGTQVFRESGFLGSFAGVDKGVLRPYGLFTFDMPVLIINGSAPQRPVSPMLFHIPGLALILALFQTTQVLNANTVQPRVNGMMSSFQRRAWEATRPSHADPLDLVVDLRPPEEVRSDYDFALSEEAIRATDPGVRKWKAEMGVVERTRYRLGLPISDDDILEPLGTYPVPGLVDKESWDAVCRSSLWNAIVSHEANGPVNAPTTLGRVEAGLARRIIARAYLNTFLISLYLAPLSEGDMDRLAGLTARLDRMLPQSAVHSI